MSKSHTAFPDDIRAGSLQVRLSRSDAEIVAAQALRYRVFVEEMGAQASAAEHESASENDHFDAYCDHMLVLDHGEGGGEPRVVGTYRLLCATASQACGRFYTADEFDISAIQAIPGEVLELGRSCVDAAYRNRAVMQLLWRGIGEYVGMHDIQAMFGCASFNGIDPQAHALALSYLHHYHSAPQELNLRALPQRYVRMDMLPKSAINAKEAFALLPPLIKGYLRLGGYVSDGAVIDHAYNTVDVGIVVKTALVTEKYVQRYGRETA